MKGTRPLTNDEIHKVAQCFEGTYEVRNRSMFMLGVSCGARISELLALTIKDVWQNEAVVTDIQFSKHIVKGKEHARTVPLNTDGQKAIAELINWYRSKGFAEKYLAPDAALFQSRISNQPVSRKSAHTVLKNAFERAGLNGKLATHSLRKSFAQRLYDQTGDIFIIKEMLGHRSTVTTQKYLGVNYRTVKEAVEAMAVNSENPRDVTPLYKVTDEMFLTEAVKRGYTINKNKDTDE